MNCNSVQVGSKISLFGERNRFTVRCKGERYILLSKRFFAQERCAVIDTWTKIAITDQRLRVKTDSSEEYARMLDRIEKGDIKLSMRNIENLNEDTTFDVGFKYPMKEYLDLSLFPRLASYTEKIVKTRTAHECCVCGNTIPPNTYTIYESGFSYVRGIGRVSQYLCRSCAENSIERINNV